MPTDEPARPDGPLIALLARARDLGFLGPGPLEAHVDHALAMARAYPSDEPERCLDLGSGAGVPGLVLALGPWANTELTLLDSNERRTSFVREAVQALGLDARVAVVRARAEDAGRLLEHRGRYQAVLSRSFGPPAVTAECGAPFLAVGGHLVVSEPPLGSVDRWDPAGVALLGLRLVGPGRQQFRVLCQVEGCPDRYPRRSGVPAKRPLFDSA